MINFVPVTSPIAPSDELWQIYYQSFPADERREWSQISEILCCPRFRLNQLFKNQELIGLITLWDFSDFLFVEHFVVRESDRGKGIGSQVLKKVLAENQKTIIVEAEEPITEEARRRIIFYERLGFSVCEGIYFQPPYSSGNNKVKMLLMSFPNKTTPLQFGEIKARLYSEVYNYKE
jgi:GNAT superfamily N-acetyltransferase